MKFYKIFIIYLITFSAITKAQTDSYLTEISSVAKDYVVEYNESSGFPIISSIENDSIQKQINYRIKDILIDQIKTDAFYTKLIEHSKRSLAANYSVNNNVNDFEGFIKEIDYTPHIESTEFRLSLTSGTTLTFLALFNYNIEFELYGDKVSISNTYYEAYYFDVKEGTEYKSEDIFKNETKSKLNTLLAKKIVEKIEVEFNWKSEIKYIDFLFEKPYSGYEEEYDTLEKVKLNTSILEVFPITKFGLFSPKSLSFEFFLPRWSLTSLDITISDISIRMSYGEILELLNLKGPFKHLVSKSLTKNVKTLKNINNPPINFLYGSPTRSQDINVPYYNKNIRRTLIYAQFVDGWDEGETFLYQEIVRNRRGLIKSINCFGEYYGAIAERKPKNVYDFKYDEKHNLIQILLDNKIINEYRYDENNNLSYLKVIEDEPSETFYKYYDSFYVSELFYSMAYHYGGNLHNQRKIVSYKKKNIYNKYDDQNRILVRGDNHGPEVTYRYDDNGNLVEKDVEHYSTSIGAMQDVFLKYNDSNKVVKISTTHTTYTFSYEYW